MAHVGRKFQSRRQGPVIYAKPWLTVRNIDVRTTGRGQAAVERNPEPAAELAELSPSQLRQRRRVGTDTARQQRRRLKAHRRALRAA